ncbi:MAG TPA: dTDP-4-dehydrorhamnose reductase [Myxococcota bacterium]|nr:dTDP-4-dehydrorhamnose reductase [Myxococcota bacterium]
MFLVTGGGGQLGSALQRTLAERGEASAALSHGELDIGDDAAIERALQRSGARVVVNCAALTKVDGCEREPALAERVNAQAPALLARACAARGAKLVQLSTDYVFAGEAQRPYREDDAPAPRSVYGRSKLAGEKAALEAPGALVVRTSWVYGRGRNFPAAILAQAREGKPLRVVADQRGRPTYAADLADAIVRLVAADARGVVNFANDGEATWLELARALLDACGFADRPIQPLTTDELALPAPRPRYSVLDLGKARALGLAPRDWRAALAAYLASEDAPAH